MGKESIIGRQKQGDSTFVPEWTDTAPILLSNNLHAVKNNPVLNNQTKLITLSTKQYTTVLKNQIAAIKRNGSQRNSLGIRPMLKGIAKTNSIGHGIEY